MQSRRADLFAFVSALAVSVSCGLLTAVWHEGNAALLFAIFAGATLGFVFPRGAWRWAIILAAWVPVLLVLRIELVESNALSWCPQNPPQAQITPWALALIPFVAVYAGVAADWVIAEALRWLGFANWQWLDRVKPALRIVALCLAVFAVLATGLLLAQPLHPYRVGESYCWDEYCFAVTQVKRLKTIGTGAHAVKAQGVFYVVTADMETPWWGRFNWSNDAVYAIDYDGTNYRFSPRGQRAMDRLLHSDRSHCHKILGAGEAETIVFDLPQDVVQPRLLVRDTLGFEGLLGGLRLNLFYVKPAFNLRYD
jgi:hypothetical protein